MPGSGSLTPVQKLLRSSALRDQSSSTSLRVTQLSDLRFAPSSCFTVSLIGDSSKCRTCQTQELCKCLRDHFQSTTNSKRRISTFLFWKNKLGLEFPVSDEMLKTVWKGLESCEYGIKSGNGQRKVPKGPVCVNPYCYHPKKWGLVLTPFVQTLQVLGMDTDAVVAQVLQRLQWVPGQPLGDNPNVNEALYEKGFDVLTARVRKMVEEEGYIRQLQSNTYGQTVKPQPYTEKYLGVPDGYDTGYESNGSPAHSTESFDPSSPPEYMTAESPHDQEVPTYTPGAHMSVQEQVVSGTVAAAMLPYLQRRQWSSGEFAEIRAIDESLRQCVAESGDGMEQDLPEDLMGLDDNLVPWMPYISNEFGQYGAHMPHTPTLEFSAGFNVPDVTAYGMDDLSALAPHMMQAAQPQHFSSFGLVDAASPSLHGNVCRTDGSTMVRASAESTMEVVRTFCKVCRRWSFSPKSAPNVRCKVSTCRASAKDLVSKVMTDVAAQSVPKIEAADGLQVGDVVALVRVHNTTRVVKLTESTYKAAEGSVGVMGLSRANPAAGDGSSSNRSSQGAPSTLRVSIVGCVDVKVRGPVRNLDIIYADLQGSAGVATATRSPHPTQCIIGQAFAADPSLATAPADSVHLVRCLISPTGNQKQLSAEHVKKMTDTVVKTVTNDATSRAVDRESSVDDLIDDVSTRVRRMTLPEPAEVPDENGDGDGNDTQHGAVQAETKGSADDDDDAPRRLSANSLRQRRSSALSKVQTPEDQSVIALLTHRTSKALRVAPKTSLVDCAGDCFDASSHFVVHMVDEEDSTDTASQGQAMRLQSVQGDSVWLRIASDDGTIGVTDDADSASTVLLLKAVNKSGTFDLMSANGQALSTPDCRHITCTVYQRVLADE